MLQSIFSGVAASANAATLPQLLIATCVSLALGAAGALLYMVRNDYQKPFVATLTLLPAMVQLVIMLVNGNLGAGIAVMGAFGLVRFRSAPGGAREIGAIFLATAIGLATGMGYIGIAAIFTGMMALATFAVYGTRFGEKRRESLELKITIPENLDYNGLFSDLFGEYLLRHELVRVKTTQMGSLFELTYRVTPRDAAASKALIDQLRCRNGNLPIQLGRAMVTAGQL